MKIILPIICFTLLYPLQSVLAVSYEPPASYNTDIGITSDSTNNASAEQAQGQYQGQAQGQGQFQSNIASGNVAFTNSFNGSEQIRYLPVPSSVAVDMRGGPSMFGRPNYEDNGPNFLSMRDTVMLLNAVDLANAEVDDEGDIDMAVQLLLSKDDIKSALAEQDENIGQDQKAISFSILEKDRIYANGDFTPLAVVSLKADDGDTINSVSLAVALARKARSVGGTKIVFVREGSIKRLSSWGVGLGLASNYAQVNSDGNGYGSTGTGGTGWSWGEAEFISLPYLTAVIGK